MALGVRREPAWYCGEVHHPPALHLFPTTAKPANALDAACAGVRWPGRSIVLLRTVPQIQVTQQADLGTVMKDLHTRIQHEPRHGCIGELGWHRRALRPGTPGIAQAADTAGPHAVSVIELTQRFAGRARI